ncbi:DMT family transporter [Marinoscillum sp. 108]|uniref:DMT family transporter n=1 Tax=Marinoscillum sp. 108 TaxID=2653151 RepID=UPI00135A592F|nr:DMT family transporter [Marinoscillum sp. 108]
MKIPDFKQHIAMLLVGLLYGTNYSIVKIITPEYILPFGLIVIRVAIATACFWLIGLSVNEKINWRADWVRIVLCAFFGVGINMLFFFKGVSLTTAINGSIIMTLTPVMVFVTSLILLKEKVTLLKVLGLAVGFLGAFLIIYSPGTGISLGNWRGDVLILLNAMSYGVYLVLVKPLMTRYTPISVAKWIFFFGFLLVLPVGWNEFTQIEWQALTAKVYFSMAFVIIGVTVIVYVLNIWALKKVNPSTVGVYIYVQPVFATLIASTFFGEILSIRHLIAALLVFAGVWLVVKRG